MSLPLVAIAGAAAGALLAAIAIVLYERKANDNVYTRKRVG